MGAMSRRRRGLPLQAIQDPGKDLFAYLFLLMMVFSFMLLMTMDEKQKNMPVQTAPDQESSSARAATAVVASARVGLLGKQDGRIILAYADGEYDLATDMNRLIADDRLVLDADDGQNVQVLYVREDLQNKLMLDEYFVASKALSDQGIRVVFVE